MTTANDNLTDLVMARPAPGLSYEWRWVRAGLGWMRTSMIVLLPVACVNALLALIVDRSDQARFLIIFGGAHGVTALPMMIGLLLCCAAPEGTKTRRQARLTAWLVVAAVVLMVVLGGGWLLTLRTNLQFPIDQRLKELFSGIGLFALMINCALALVAWSCIHGAMARDLHFTSLDTYRLHFEMGWIAILYAAIAVICSLCIARALWSHDLEISAAGAVLVVILILDALYFRVLNRNWQALCVCMFDPSMLDVETILSDHSSHKVD